MSIYICIKLIKILIIGEIVTSLWKLHLNIFLKILETTKMWIFLYIEYREKIKRTSIKANVKKNLK